MTAAISESAGVAGSGFPSPSARIASSEVATSSARAAPPFKVTAEMRSPGHASARAAVSARGIPIRNFGVALFSARLMPRAPRPASTTTTTAPIRQHA
jgi:hypothetical protein